MRGKQGVTKGSQLIGQLIQELRKQRNMTGEELGRRVGMSQSKISKLENGLYPRLDFKAIERILNILNAPHVTRQRIYRTMDTVRPGEPRYRPYDDIQYSKDTYERDRKATLIRIFSPFGVPALLQTDEYRIALLRSWGSLEDDMAIIKASAERQELLWDKHRHFHFIVHQAMFYTRLPQGKGMNMRQIDRIDRFMNLPNIKFGIIPLESGMPMVEIGPFGIVDERIIVTATVRGDIVSTNSKSIVLHSRIFADLNRLAVYGDDAQRLMNLAADFWV